MSHWNLHHSIAKYTLPLFLIHCLCSWGTAIGADNSVLPQTWVTTNSLGDTKTLTNYNAQIDLTPTVKTNVPDSDTNFNGSAKLLLRNCEPTVTLVTASALIGHKIVAHYDLRSSGSVDTTSMTLQESYNVWKTNQTLLKFGYYRGRIYRPESRSFSHEWITVFSTDKRERIVVVCDSGPIYFSETSGASWSGILQPGWYEFTMATTPKGSAIVASVALGNIPAATNPEVIQNMTSREWYSAVSSGDGDELVLQGGSSIFTPALSIVTSSNNIIVSWPNAFTGYHLQQNDDLTTTNWINVTNTTSLTDSQYEVVLPASSFNKFFRLKAH